jgi:hypothetical protein
VGVIKILFLFLKKKMTRKTSDKNFIYSKNVDFLKIDVYILVKRVLKKI